MATTRFWSDRAVLIWIACSLSAAGSRTNVPSLNQPLGRKKSGISTRSGDRDALTAGNDGKTNAILVLSEFCPMDLPSAVIQPGGTTSNWLTLFANDVAAGGASVPVETQPVASKASKTRL